MRLLTVRLILLLVFVAIGPSLALAAFLVGGPGYVVEVFQGLTREAEQDWFTNWRKPNLWRWGP